MEQIDHFDYYNLAKFEYLPKISLAVPVYNTRDNWLRQFLNSVINQSYENWELSIYDDGSNDHTHSVLSEYTMKDPRIVAIRAEHIGGGPALQKAVDNCTGDYIGLPDSDDILSPHALQVFILYLNFYGSDNINVAYTNELMTDESGVPTIPIFKPSFNHGLLFFLHYFGHLTFYKSDVIKSIGVKTYRGSYDYALALRSSLVVPHSTIINIREFLYKYRIHPTSTSAMNYVELRLGGKEALNDHLISLSLPNSIIHENISLYQVETANGMIPKIDLDKLYDYPVFKPHFYDTIFKSSDLF